MSDRKQITAAARTVEHLGVYMAELKIEAQRLSGTVQARDRAYFTPSEEEQTKALFISYLQTRAALLDLVFSLHDYVESSPEEEYEAFVVGYAGAILLVDAARFMVESYGDSDVIVRKLNEADSRFRIEPGTFDEIRRSMTDPLNAWRLYQANSYFDEHESHVRQIANQRQWHAVIDVVDQLGARVRVSPREYAEARARVRANQLVDAVTELAASRLLYGLQEMFSRMASDISVSPRHASHLPPDVRRQLDELLQPGDVLVTRKEHALTNYFLPGYWPHAALYLGDSATLTDRGFNRHAHVRNRWPEFHSLDADEPRRVLEALKDGVWLRSLTSPASSDAIAVIRPSIDEAAIIDALARALAHEGKPYDFDFDFTRSDRMVCTEVIYRTYEGVADVRFDLTRRVGRLTLSAEDLLGMALRHEHFTTVAAFAPGLVQSLQTDAAAEQLLRDTIGQTN